MSTHFVSNTPIFYGKTGKEEEDEITLGKSSAPTEKIICSPPPSLFMEREEPSMYLPEWPIWTEIELPRSEEELSRLLIQSSSTPESRYTISQKEQMDKILSYLSAKEPTVYPAKMRKVESAGPNLCCNRLAKIFGGLCMNPIQLAKDTLCCFCVSASDQKPDRHVWVTKTVFDKLNENRRDTNRNSVFLLGIAPALTISLPLITLPTGIAATVIGIGLNLLLLYSAGVQTFLLVDYGSGELLSSVITTKGFEQLAIYLLEKWENAEGHQKEEMKNQVLHICKNVPHLKKGMMNCGIQESLVNAILSSFVQSLNKINKDIERETLNKMKAVKV